MNPEVDFLEYVIKTIVEYPDDVKISRRVDDMGVLITLDVNPLDMGKIIGKQGSIRTLLRTVGMKNHARVNLKITDPRAASTRIAMSDEELSTL